MWLLANINKVRCLMPRLNHNFATLEDLNNTSILTNEVLDSIEKNILLRQANNNVPAIRTLLQKLKQQANQSTDTAKQLHAQLQVELRTVPNATHPRLLTYNNKPRELCHYVHRNPPENAKEFSQICKHLNLLRMEHLGNFTGHKSYYLLGHLATMEQAIIQYAIKSVHAQGFKLISVPDILPKAVIENCGMRTEGERTQVYKLDSGMCLSGTAEMSLAAFFANQVFDEFELPIKVIASSRCYRAETSGLQEEKGIYRVHQFNKVEMFAVCAENQSETELEEFKKIEVNLFKNLGINFRLLDMPPCELGAPAYHKYDIEAWMPGRNMWGEISSCSNCTDYQAKRLKIKYRSAKDGTEKFAHTINGTAVAIPRLLIALIEMNQETNLTNVIKIPDVLVPYMGCDTIVRISKIPELKLIKQIKSTDQ